MKIPFSPPYIDEAVINEVVDSLRSGWRNISALLHCLGQKAFTDPYLTFMIIIYKILFHLSTSCPA